MSQPSSDAPRPEGPWFKLGRLLPAVLRHRVFEPAYFDLLAESQRPGAGRRRLGFKVFVLALEAYRVGGPGVLWDVRRTSRTARVIFALLLVAFALTAFMIAGYQYPADPSSPSSGMP